MNKITSDKKDKPAEKKERVKPSYALKRKVISEISNGRISRNYASKKYQISRSTLEYWMEKFSTLEDKQNFMSKDLEIKKLKERVQELEFVKDLQQEIMAEMELLSGRGLIKKHLPEYLAKEIELKLKKRKLL